MDPIPEDIIRQIVAEDKFGADWWRNTRVESFPGTLIIATGILLALGALYCTIEPITLGINKGFSTQIPIRGLGGGYGVGRYPVHILFIQPLILGAVSIFVIKTGLRKRAFDLEE